VQPVRKAAERIGIHRRSLPRLQAPENDMRAVKTPRRSLGHNGGWRAAKKDGARDAAGGSHLALPPPPGLWIRSGQFAPQDFPRRAPLVPHLGAHIRTGERSVGKLKRRLCLLCS